jgi:hypothetical protein
MRKYLCLFLLVASLCIGGQSSASIINGTDIGGFSTFVDQATGFIWMDLDNFFNMNTTDMVNAANTAGFTFASKADVVQLLNSLPITNNEWSTYASIMGQAPNRDLIWASYDDGGSPFGYAYSYSTDRSWSIYDDIVASNDIPNGGGLYADMNIWAYQTGGNTNVPEPYTIFFLSSGIVALFGIRRNLRK